MPGDPLGIPGTPGEEPSGWEYLRPVGGGTQCAELCAGTGTPHIISFKVAIFMLMNPFLRIFMESRSPLVNCGHLPNSIRIYELFYQKVVA